MKKLMLGILIVAVGWGATGARGADDNWGVVTDAEWATGAPADYPEADAVVLFDRGYQTVEIPHGEWYAHTVLERHVRIKVLTRAGVDKAGNAEFSVYTDEMLQEVKAHTIAPDGTVYEVGKDDYFDKKVGKWRYCTFAFPKIDSGSIVEYFYRTDRDRAVGLAPWYFHHSIYTLESTITIEMGGGFTYDYLARNVSTADQRPVVQNLEGLGRTTAKAYTWRLRNLPPIKPEPYMTCVEDYMSSLHVRFKGLNTDAYKYEAPDEWKDLAILAEVGMKDYLSKPRKFKKMVHDVTRDCKSDYDKSKAIYDYIVTNVETRQDGYYGTVGHDNLAELCKEGYGTAWEKNVLLIEMLRAARIKAWPILICTRDNARFDPRWLDLSQFSHMIVFTEVEQGGIYLDATSKYCAYGTLPPLCRTNAGLLIDGDHSELVKIVTNDPSSMRVDMHKVRLTAEGDAACTTTAMFCGYLASEYGGRYETHDPGDFIQDDILGDLPATYHAGTYQCRLDSLNRLRVVTNYTLDGYARRLDDNLVVRPMECLFATNPFSSRKRFFPVDFNYDFSYQDVVQVEAPEHATIRSLPPDTTIAIDGVSFMRQSSSEGPLVTVQMKIAVSRPYFEVGEYDRLRRFFDEVATLGSDQIVFGMQEE